MLICFVVSHISETYLNSPEIDFRDIAYVTASGSIIATAGYSSDAINVVIWDTLAPPTTSRASIMCHEGFFLLSEFTFQ